MAVPRAMMRPMASLETAQEALLAGSWSRADGDFRAVIEETGDPAAYEGLAQVAWWRDDGDTCLGARETAYRLHRERRDPVGAARAAVALGWDSVLFGRGESVALGWIGRAQELLAEVAERPEHGWCAVREAELALSVHQDPGAALACAERAVAVGRRTGDGDLEVVGLALQGLALTRAARVEEGTERLNAAAAAATAGDVADLMWMGKVLCWLIAACHETQDVTRAEDWCRRVEMICRERDLAPLLNVCRIQYASVQVSAGTWAEADQELTGTVERLAGSTRASRLEAVVQLGELRRRQGRHDEAEALFRQAEFDPVAVLGRALIRDAAGDHSSAWAQVRQLLAALPPEGRLARADVLLSAVRMAHAVGDVAAADEAAGELRATAQAVRTDALLAMSALADAVLADAEDAPGLLREAVQHHHRAGLRHDEAEARLLLAAALAARGDEPAAREQAEAASEVLAGLPDTAGLARARGLAATLGGDPGSTLSAREREVLELVARGLSNDQIAAELTLSPHTVHRHVSNILTKLDQPTRAAAVSRALSTGLL